MKGIHTAVAAALLALGAGSLDAQGGVERSALAQLLQLEGRWVHVSYSPGSLDRAVRLQRRFTNLASDFASWSKQRERVLLHVFDRQDWERSALGLPYGFPARMPLMSVAVAARGDAGTVELWQGYLGSALPALDPVPMLGTPQEAASIAVTDLFAQVEAARTLLAKADLLGAEGWITELIAHALVADARARHEPGVGAVMGDLAARLVAARGAEPPPPLSAYRAGLSIDDWLWFQARFHQGAAALGAGRGKSQTVAKRLLKLARKRAQPLDAATLIKRFPEVSGWRASSFAAE